MIAVSGDTMTALSSEIESAHAAHGEFNSTHEALGVLCEEWDELREAIHRNDAAAIAEEALQVSAVALRLAALCRAVTAGDAVPFAQRSGLVP